MGALASMQEQDPVSWEVLLVMFEGDVDHPETVQLLAAIAQVGPV